VRKGRDKGRKKVRTTLLRDVGQNERAASEKKKERRSCQQLGESKVGPLASKKKARKGIYSIDSSAPQGNTKNHIGGDSRRDSYTIRPGDEQLLGFTGKKKNGLGKKGGGGRKEEDAQIPRMV